MSILGVDLLPSSPFLGCLHRLFAKTQFQSLSYFLLNLKMQTAFSQVIFWGSVYIFFKYKSALEVYCILF